MNPADATDVPDFTTDVPVVPDHQVDDPVVLDILTDDLVVPNTFAFGPVISGSQGDGLVFLAFQMMVCLSLNL